MEDGIELGFWTELVLVLLTCWPKKVVPTTAKSDDGSALSGRVISAPLPVLHVVEIGKVWSLDSLPRKPESSPPNHMYVVGYVLRVSVFFRAEPTL